MARILLSTFLILLVVTAGCKKKAPIVPANTSETTNSDSASNSGEADPRIVELTNSEELISALAQKMSQLAKSFADKSAPLASVVQNKISYQGPVEFDVEKLVQKSRNESGLPNLIKVELAESPAELEIDSTRIWSSIMADNQFDSCQFGTVGSHFEGEAFFTETVFEGRFRDRNESTVGVKSLQTLKWTADEDDQWSIAGWKQTKFDLIAIEKTLFEDVTAIAIPDQATFEKVQACSHCKLIIENASLETAKFRPARTRFKYFSDWESAYQFPAVSVVDFNGDGFDDLFVTDRWEPAQLLKNKGDGTFVDVTEASGLVIDELASCTLFADFDNDGDPDVFVGGTLNPSRYYENDNGVFKQDNSLDFAMKDIRFVVSGSVSDLNGDGLLDLYLCTYGVGSGNVDQWINSAVRPQDRARFKQSLANSQFYINRAGPPNIVLLNRNGKLVRANQIDGPTAQWRNSYQSIWTDLDADGDPDLYVCNDFSPDSFLRNDTEKGSFEPKFVDISKELVPDGEMGFGMGASWGDYNNDGLLDIYVSNMYSKAGKRILKTFPDVDERAKTASRGNFLFKNVGGKFEQVAGTSASDQQVSKVGWSFGGQFADFDNDSKLDIYVPSGFYTPPSEVRKEGDW